MERRSFMTLESLYKKIGGDYQEIFHRLRKEERIEKFVLLFLKDQSYQNFQDGLKEKEMEHAFRAVHTLKGVSLNLGFQQLFKISDQMTEALRASDMEKICQLLPEFEACYQQHVDVVSEYADSLT